MAQTVLEKKTCEKCGVAIRENTAFCFNCGNPVVEEPDISLDETIHISPSDPEPADKESIDPKTQAALDDLAEQLRRGETEDDKLAKAAAERRRARVAQQKKAREFRWEADENSSTIRMLLVAVAVAIVAGIIVLLTVVWR